MSVPAYPAYKDSGVEWLGKVPSHWKVVQLRALIGRIEAGTSVNAVDKPAEGDEIGVLKTSCVYDGTFREAENKAIFPEEADRATCPVQAGCLIVSRMNTPELVGATGLVREPAPGLFLPDRLWQVHLDNVEPEFLYRWTGSAEYRAQVKVACGGTSSSMQNLSQDGFLAFRLAVAPPAEQVTIAAFLDRETGKIDALVEEQRRLIALLKEKRQAVISHAVTKGLNPQAPLKPSGIEWLGDIPAHWEVKRLKHVAPAITVGIVVEPSKLYAESGVPALRSLNVRPGRIDEDNLVYITAEGHEMHRKSRLATGDIVAVRTGQPGTAAVVPPKLDGCNCIDLIVIRKPPHGCEQFLCWFLASETAVRQFTEGSGGAIQQHFNIGTAADLVVTVPPETEQREIADHLHRTTGALDALVAEADRGITLLQERRAALISAAVTGKIDVQGLMAAPKAKEAA